MNEGLVGRPNTGTAGASLASFERTDGMWRILACVYACVSEPGVTLLGGEPGLGWNLLKQLGRFNRVWALTSEQNRPAIEAALRHESLPNVQFYYFNLPRWLRPLLRVQAGIRVYAYLWQVKAYFVARSLDRQFQFDLFHHVTYANDWMASFIGALLPIPYLRGPGGGANRTPSRFLGVYSLSDRLWEFLRTLSQWLLRRDPFFLLGQRRARMLLVCNRESKRAIPRRWRNKTELFPVNGISSSDFGVLASAAIPNHRFRVCSAGRLVHWKGFTLAVKAFSLFATRHPEARLSILGDGPQRSRLEDLVHRLGLQTQVCFEEWMPREKLLQEMHSCDVFLFPSLRDGGGAVVVEAMAAGKPVVCLDLAGPGIHVTDACGIKVPANSPEQAVSDMALALERLYNDKELRCRMGKAARARAEQVYHWDRLGERLNQIYAQALSVPPTHDKLRSSQ